MPTFAGIRRRGVPPEAIRDFVHAVGVARADSIVEVAMLDYAVREHAQQDRAAAHGGAAAAQGRDRELSGGQDRGAGRDQQSRGWRAGSRPITFGRDLYIERDDFMENPPKKFFRLAPGREVRLRYAYFITCREAIKDAGGEVVELRCTYDPATRGGNAARRPQGKGDPPLGRRADAVRPKCGSYNQLFTRPDRTSTATSPTQSRLARGAAPAALEPALAAAPGEP